MIGTNKLSLSIVNDSNETVRVSIKTGKMKKQEKFSNNLKSQVEFDLSKDYRYDWQDNSWTINPFDIAEAGKDNSLTLSLVIAHKQPTEKGNELDLFNLSEKTNSIFRKLLVTVKNNNTGLVTSSRYLLIGDDEESYRLVPVSNKSYKLLFSSENQPTGSFIVHDYYNKHSGQDEVVLYTGKNNKIVLRNLYNTNNQLDYSNWMKDFFNNASLKNTKLIEMIIIGSHDASTNKIPVIHDELCVSSDIDAGFTLSKLTNVLSKTSVKKVSKAQNLTISKQLEAGSRYLDFRICFFEKLEAYYTIHTYASNNALDDLFNIKSFIEKNKKEIIFININRIIIESEQISKSKGQEDFLIIVKDILGEYMLTQKDLNDDGFEGLHEVSYDYIVNIKKKNIIFIIPFDNKHNKDKKKVDYSLKSIFEKDFFSISLVHTDNKKTWANTDNVNKLGQFVQESSKEENQQRGKLFKTSIQLTSQPRSYLNILAARNCSVGSLKNLALMSNPIMFDFLLETVRNNKNNDFKNYFNIISADFVGSSFMPGEWALKLNEEALLKADIRTYIDNIKSEIKLKIYNKTELKNDFSDMVYNIVSNQLQKNKINDEFLKAINVICAHIYIYRIKYDSILRLEILDELIKKYFNNNFIDNSFSKEQLVNCIYSLLYPGFFFNTLGEDYSNIIKQFLFDEYKFQRNFISEKIYSVKKYLAQLILQFQNNYLSSIKNDFKNKIHQDLEKIFIREKKVLPYNEENKTFFSVLEYLIQIAFFKCICDNKKQQINFQDLIVWLINSNYNVDNRLHITNIYKFLFENNNQLLSDKNLKVIHKIYLTQIVGFIKEIIFKTENENIEDIDTNLQLLLSNDFNKNEDNSVSEFSQSRREANLDTILNLLESVKSPDFPGYVREVDKQHETNQKSKNDLYEAKLFDE